MRSALRELAVVAGFLLVAIVLTWPLAANLDRAISDPGDPYFTTWAIDWNYHAATTPASLFQANIFSPEKNALAFSEHMAGIAVFLFPLLAIGVAPLTAHNVALLAGFAACAYAMYLLARWTTRSTLAGVIAGLAYGFVGFRFHHLPHVHFVWSMWLPVLLLGLLMHAERPRRASAILICAALVMNGLTSAHWLVFGGAALVIAALVLTLAARRVDAKFWLLLAAAIAAAAVILLPFLLPYREVRAAHGTDRLFEEVYENGAKWRDFFQPYWGSLLYGRWATEEAIGHERTLFPGMAVLFAALAAFVSALFSSDPPAGRGRRRARAVLDTAIVIAAVLAVLGVMAGDVELAAGGQEILSYHGSALATFALLLLIGLRLWVAPLRRRSEAEAADTPRVRLALTAAASWIAIGVLGARGLRGFFHAALFDSVNLYRGIRMPGRWMMLAYVGLALAAAVFAARSLRTRRVSMVALLLAAAVLAESWVQPIRWYLVPNEPRPVYDWLATVPFRGAVAEVPFTQWFTYEYMWRATRHHRPLINGVSSYTPRGYQQIADLYAASPIPDGLFDALEARGCSLLVVHEGILREKNAEVRDWIGRGLRAGRIAFVRRFAEGGSADLVFAMTKNEPGSARWQAAEVPDPAGRTPSQNLELFLQDGWAWVGGVMMRVDEGPRGVVRGRLTVSGWLVSEQGAKDVRIRFANGRHAYEAVRFARPDVGALLPWHPDTAQAGFRLEVPAPPPGIDGDTDMVIEIVTAGGSVVRTGPALFAWRPAAKNPPQWREAELAALLGRLGAPAGAADRVRSGASAIQDFTAPLVTQPELETDRRFAEHAVETLLGERDARLVSRAWRQAAEGIGRRRVVEGILTSNAFRDRFLAGGRIALD